MDEVSQTGSLVLLILGPVLLYLGPVEPPYWANRTLRIGQNSVKYSHTLGYRDTPLQYTAELHQKDLRINLVLVHILGLRMRHVLRADTFLALFLIVGFYVSRGSLLPRRVVISVIRPCKLS